MLGKSIADAERIESQEAYAEGLGLLDIKTVFNRNKTATQVKAQVVGDKGLLQGMKGIEIDGYEIHMGQTGSQGYSAAFKIVETPGAEKDCFDGAISSDGLILGTYIHGLFHNADFTRAFLSRLRQLRGLPAVLTAVLNKEEHYNKLADVVRENLDMPGIYKIILERD
jgi:adenosylcobyric acid synthase